MNVLTVPGVPNEPFKAALEGSLAANGYLASEGTTPKFYIDAEIQDLDQPLIGLEYDVKSSVLYKVSGARSRQDLPDQGDRNRGIFRLPAWRRPHAHGQRTCDAAEHQVVSAGIAVTGDGCARPRAEHVRHPIQTDSRCRMASSVSTSAGAPCAMIWPFSIT